MAEKKRADDWPDKVKPKVVMKDEPVNPALEIEMGPVFEKEIVAVTETQEMYDLTNPIAPQLVGKQVIRRQVATWTVPCDVKGATLDEHGEPVKKVEKKPSVIEQAN